MSEDFFESIEGSAPNRCVQQIDSQHFLHIPPPHITLFTHFTFQYKPNYYSVKMPHRNVHYAQWSLFAWWEAPLGVFCRKCKQMCPQYVLILNLICGNFNTYFSPNFLTFLLEHVNSAKSIIHFILQGVHTYWWYEKTTCRYLNENKQGEYSKSFLSHLFLIINSGCEVMTISTVLCGGLRLDRN